MLNVCVLFVMVSTTITVASSNISPRSCTLPMFPTYGTYTVTSDPSATPGQTLDYFIMTVSCRRGFGFGESGNRTQELICAAGVWSQQMPKCVRFCRLNAHHSMKYECRLPGQGQGTCEGFVPPRTTVIATCKPQFFSANEVEYMTCMEYGIWDRIVNCQAECGVVTPQAELQLVGGRFTKFGEFPWHVGIYDKTEQPYGQLCSGSIITNNLVISAAHCFWDDVIKLLPETQFVVATAKLHRKWNDERDILAQKSEIKKIKIPSLFIGSAASFQQDIAILILKSPFTYLPYVRPVCYDFNSFFEREQLHHLNLGKVPGWGLTAANGGPSPTLKIVDMPYVSEDVCIKSVPRSFRPYITGDKFCAGYTDGTSAVCKGDSGGGLVFVAHERNKERYYLRGIVSASPRNDDKICNDYTFAAFTKISEHKKFIEEASQLCILPPYPKHGKYEVANKPSARPGFQADSFVVTVTCDNGYRLKADGIVDGTASPEVYCFDGQWIPELPRCVAIAVGANESWKGDRESAAVSRPPNLPRAEARRVSERKCTEYTGYDEREQKLPLSDICDYEVKKPGLGVQKADLFEFPHVAAIGWASSRGYSYYCGGTLISPRFVLSAGQCSSRMDLRFPEPIIIRLSSTTPVNVPIKKIIPHPDNHTDIALFELARTIETVKPVCLWSKPDFSGNRTVAAPFWRSTDTSKGNNLNELLKVTLSIIDSQECYMELDKQYITWNSTDPTQMCAKELPGQNSTCQIIPGSPLQVASAAASQEHCSYHIMGVYSFCVWEKPGVYTQVSSIIDWIESVVWPEEI